MRGWGWRAKALVQARGEFLIDGVKSSVGEQRHNVAGGELGHESGDDAVDIGVQLSGRAFGVEQANDIFRVQMLGLGDALLLVDAGEDHAVGKAQAGDEVGFEDFAAKGVGARFQNRPDASRRINGTERTQGFANGCGVMGEVFDDGDAGNFGADFEAALGSGRWRGPG